MDIEEKTDETPEVTIDKAPEVSDAPVIDPAADEPTREQQAKDYLYKIIDDEPPPEESRVSPAKVADEPKDDAGDKPGATTDPPSDDKPIKGSLGEYERQLRAQAKQLEKMQADIDARLAAKDPDDPIELLRSRGHDIDKIIDRLIIGDIGKGKPEVAAKSEESQRIAALEKEISDQKARAAYTEAASAVNEKLSATSHKWLMLEDRPVDIVLQYIQDEYSKDPDSDPLTIEEAASKKEAEYAAKAKRILEAGGASDGGPTKGANLRNTGASVTNKSWDELSVEERERHSLAELKSQLRQNR